MVDPKVNRVVCDFLPASTFEMVVDSAPLVSIDLVVRNSQGQILLGKRSNRPAQGFWFVPGGRIRKNESLAQAFERLCRDELGQVVALDEASYLGLYEHFYQDSIFTGSSRSISTHYIVSAFEIAVDISQNTLPSEQHNQYQWFDESLLLSDPEVHLHTKWYFQKDKGFL